MELVEATVEAVHASDVPLDRLRAWRIRPTDSALVLGSAQPLGRVDLREAHRLGWNVVRRRSGGGLVAVEPGSVAWVEVALPASQPEWTPDVSRSGIWLGRGWAVALERVGVQAVVHEGPTQRRSLGAVVCFAGCAPGEVTTPEGGKIVGVSQRRTRDGVRFQCLLHRRWDPTRWLPAVIADPGERTRLEVALAGVVGVDDRVGEGATEVVLDALAAWLAVR